MKDFHVRRRGHWIVVSLFLTVAGCGGDSGTGNGDDGNGTGNGTGARPQATAHHADSLADVAASDAAAPVAADAALLDLEAEALVGAPQTVESRARDAEGNGKIAVNSAGALGAVLRLFERSRDAMNTASSGAQRGRNRLRNRDIG